MIPNQRIIDLMDPKDREQNLPKPIRLTSSERRAADEAKGERAMHDEFIRYLKLRKKVFAYIHASTVDPSTIQRGHPDFTVLCKVAFGPRLKTCSCLIEFKVPGATLTKSQVKRFGELSEAGIDIFVCTSAGDAIEQIIEYFELPKEALV